MTSAVKHVMQLMLAAAALVGAALSWLQVTSLVDVPPVREGEPATVSVVYDPPLMMLSWVLVTVGGVLAVLGIAGLRRSRKSAPAR